MYIPSLVILLYRFLPCAAMLEWYMLSLCVRPSVCPSQAGTVPKWLDVGSHKQCHMIAQDSSFLNLGAIQTGSPSMCVPNRGGVGSNLRFLTNIFLYRRNGAR